ncbi:TPA: DJ-1/PfpI family protein [Candidatus Bathyarchaeota archaeon]|nr:DJ-1/PfpI family protein [Candidatus Bathyarchaeota archaeon]
MRRGLAAIVLVVLIVACFGVYYAWLARPPEEIPGIRGKRVLFVIAPENFRDEELEHPKEVLLEAGAAVTIASKTTDPAKGVMGAVITPDIALSQVNALDYDAVIFVGGPGAEAYFNDVEALSIAREAYEGGKKVAAICIAPVILANAGILDGKRATVWSSATDRSFVEMIEAKGAVYTGEDVTVDGKVITENGPGAAREFAVVIATELGGP